MAKISINLSSGELEKPDDVVVGIDLGTTNSLVAYTNDKGDARILQRGQSAKLVPSVIYFDENDQPLVGHRAVELMRQHPERSIFSIKRLMGKSFRDIEAYKNFFVYDIIERDEEELVRIKVGEKFYTPIDLSAMILRELKDIAESELNRPVTKAVVTVPAYFNDSQRQATKDAGKLAGLNILRIINEPTAASLAYGVDKMDKQQTIAVYDLGGGTFDISILNLSNGIFEVLATNGDTFLGGDDFDKCIVDHWAKQLLDGDQYSNSELRLLAEHAKKEINNGLIFEREFHGKTLSLRPEVFKEITSELIQRTIKSCSQALRDANLSTSDIDQVLAVGGSTRMLVAKEAIEAFFGKTIVSGINPDEAVALGAAIQADILSGRRSDMLLLDVTPLSLGIETVGGLMDTILPRNSKIPAAVGRNYTTSIDGQQNLKVAIFQGERDMVQDNRKLGEFILKNIPPMAAGLPKIEIKFLIDADGILQVIASELRSGVKQEIQVKPQYGISEEEMGRMLLDSIKHAESDVKNRALIEAKTEAKSIVLSATKFIEQNKSWLSDEQVKTIDSSKTALEQTLAGDDKDSILAAIEKLNEKTAPLAHEALDRNIADNLKQINEID